MLCSRRTKVSEEDARANEISLEMMSQSSELMGSNLAVAKGEQVVWGSDNKGRLWVKTGITDANPTPDNWKQVDAYVTKFSVGPENTLWGIHGGKVFCRDGITSANRAGTKWLGVEGYLTHIAVGGNYSVWGCNASHIFFRKGVSATNKIGTEWVRMDGGLDQIEVGPTGAVWGLGGKLLHYRVGVTKANPMGTSWLRMNGGLHQISVGLKGIWAVSGGVPHYKPLDTPMGKGGGWTSLNGLINSITTDVTGRVWGAQAATQTCWTRTGVTSTSPMGKSWKKQVGNISQIRSAVQPFDAVTKWSPADELGAAYYAPDYKAKDVARFEPTMWHAGEKAAEYDCGKYKTSEKAAQACNHDPKCNGFSVPMKGSICLSTSEDAGEGGKIAVFYPLAGRHIVDDFMCKK